MPAIIAIPAGLLIGLSLGALGGGGSTLTVPALVYLLHQQPHAATTAALAARLGASVHLDWPLIGMFTLAALAGTLGGNRVAARVSASKLTAAFTVLLIVVAVYTLSRGLTA